MAALHDDCSESDNWLQFNTTIEAGAGFSHTQIHTHTPTHVRVRVLVRITIMMNRRHITMAKL